MLCSGTHVMVLTLVLTVFVRCNYDGGVDVVIGAGVVWCVRVDGVDMCVCVGDVT